MATINLLLPAEPDVLADFYALEEPLLLQLRPAPDEDGEPWSPLPDTLDGEALYEAYQRVLDALPTEMVDVIRGRMDRVPGVPMLIGTDGRELVQLLDVEVEAEDLVRLAWLRDALTAADGDELGAFLDDIADDRHAPWWTGEGTSGAAVAAWARRAINSLINREMDGRAELLAVVRAGAGQDRIELTVEQEVAYSRYIVAVIRVGAATRTGADLAAFTMGLR
jgi:hypothetical protein